MKSHFGKLRSLHLDKGRCTHFRQTSRYFRLATSSWSNHEDIPGRNLFSHPRALQLCSPPARPKRERDGSFRAVLTHDTLIKH